MSDVVIHPKYLPLFQLLEGKHPEVDTVIITGGRYSAKSYNIGLWSTIALVNYDYSVLFTRYTNVSIVDSIKPNVDDKIKLLGFEPYVNNTITHIERGKERIAFKGIKTGSHQQTANLKSLEQFNAFVVDEADEMPDYETFEKVFLSIRSLSKRNITILSLNPSSVQHWIFKQFYKDKGLRGGENTIVDNVMFIHTSYLDLPTKLVPTNILSYYNKLKEKNIKKYNHVVLGEWVKDVEGQVFKDWKETDLLTYTQVKAKENSSIDFGASDPMAVLNWKYEVLDDGTQNLYLREIFYKSENDVLAELDSSVNYKKDDGSILLYIANLINHPKQMFTICDNGGARNNYSSNNFKIAKLLDNGYNVTPALKAPNSIHLGIEILKSINVYYIGENIDFEVNNYTNDSDREGFIDGKYIDKNNHTIDCARNISLFLYKAGLIKYN
jgi:phage terminase large subunit